MKTFLHLSDIHFSGWSGNSVDLDLDLRSEIENDLQVLKKKEGVRIDYVLITGDVAYSAQPDEYAKAAEWLQRIAELLEFDKANIWIVPGNHDVDWTVVRQSKTLRSLPTLIETTDPSYIAELVADWHNDPALNESIYLPLENYNKFAEEFRCAISADNPTWENQEPILLADGVELRLRGLNSTLASTSEDREWDGPTPANLLLGTHQMPPYLAGVAYITMCHHPLNWIKDRDSVQPYLQTRVALQLYGHVHQHQVTATSTSISLVAGAVHPERKGIKLVPGYNVFRCSVVDMAGAKHLSIDVMPRAWSSDDAMFINNSPEESQGFVTHTVAIDRGARAPQKTEQETITVVESQQPTPEPTAATDDQSQVWRTALHQFLTQPYYDRIKIARLLNVLDDGDEHLSDRKKFERIVARIKERDLLEELVAASRSLENEKE